LVERVKITPSQILLKDSDGNIKFNTNYAYIKTGSGTLYAGGYDRAPAIYGQNTISDHTDGGGYVSGLFGGSFQLYQNWTYYTNVPKSNNVVFRDLSDGWGPADTEFVSPLSRYLYYYNYDTKQRENTGIIFTWAMNLFYNGSYKYLVYPKFYSVPQQLPAVTNVNGGTFEFDYTANEYQNWTRTVQVQDWDSSYYNEEQTANGRVEAYTIEIKRAGIFSTRPPTALSLAVTP
jgi:hypothetical protein